MVSSHLIQWNCRGFKCNFSELKLLTQSFNPLVIALQETHLKDSDRISFKGYELYNTFGPIEEDGAS